FVTRLANFGEFLFQAGILTFLFLEGRLVLSRGSAGSLQLFTQIFFDALPFLGLLLQLGPDGSQLSGNLLLLLLQLISCLAHLRQFFLQASGLTVLVFERDGASFRGGFGGVLLFAQFGFNPLPILRLLLRRGLSAL